MSDYGYGMWLVAINSLVIIIFAASFFRPKMGRGLAGVRGAHSGFPAATALRLAGGAARATARVSRDGARGVW